MSGPTSIYQHPDGAEWEREFRERLDALGPAELEEVIEAERAATSRVHECADRMSFEDGAALWRIQVWKPLPSAPGCPEVPAQFMGTRTGYCCHSIDTWEKEWPGWSMLRAAACAEESFLLRYRPALLSVELDGSLLIRGYERSCSTDRLEGNWYSVYWRLMRHGACSLGRAGEVLGSQASRDHLLAVRRMLAARGIPEACGPENGGQESSS